MKKSQKAFIIFFAVILGWLLIKQFASAERSSNLTQNENLVNLSYEIIESSSSIFDLQKEYDSLKTKNNSFSFNMKDKTRMKDDIESKISDYMSINGLSDISGRGIEIKAEGTMLTEEIVDLINGIRNTKPDAIAINNQRIIYNSYFIVKNNGELEFDNKSVGFPIYIQVLGDPDILLKSLDRSGGILDILNKNSFDKIHFTIERRDNLSLPSYGGKIIFRYTKNI